MMSTEYSRGCNKQMCKIFTILSTKIVRRPLFRMGKFLFVVIVFSLKFDTLSKVKVIRPKSEGSSFVVFTSRPASYPSLLNASKMNSMIELMVM